MIKSLTRLVGKVFYFKDSGKVSGSHDKLWGNCSRLSGNLDDCEITDEERKQGIKIKELIKEDEQTTRNAEH